MTRGKLNADLQGRGGERAVSLVFFTMTGVFKFGGETLANVDYHTWFSKRVEACFNDSTDGNPFYCVPGHYADFHDTLFGVENVDNVEDGSEGVDHNDHRHDMKTLTHVETRHGKVDKDEQAKYDRMGEERDAQAAARQEERDAQAAAWQETVRTTYGSDCTIASDETCCKCCHDSENKYTHNGPSGRTEMCQMNGKFRTCHGEGHGCIQ